MDSTIGLTNIEMDYDDSSDNDTNDSLSAASSAEDFLFNATSDFTSTDVVILTLNARGLADQSKRSLTFQFLRSTSSDIIALQETHTPAADADFWTQQWGV